jgi:hypothetical protein
VLAKTGVNSIPVNSDSCSINLFDEKNQEPGSQNSDHVKIYKRKLLECDHIQ